MILSLLSLSLSLSLRYRPFRFFSPTSWYFVFFRKSHCSFCEEVFPEFARTSAVFANITNLSFFSIDCTNYTSFCHSHDVFGVPDLLLLNRWKTVVRRFSGNRTAENMIGFVTSSISATPPSNFMAVHPMDSSLVELSISAGKCAAIPLFAPPVPLHFREAFDFFVDDPDFLPAIAPPSLSATLAQLFRVLTGPRLVAVTLLGFYPVTGNTSADVWKELSTVCHETYRAVMVSYVSDLKAGKREASLQTIFGPFDRGMSYVRLAQKVWQMPIENVSRHIESLRKAILTWKMRDGFVLRMAQKIAILSTVKAMRLKEKENEKESD